MGTLSSFNDFNVKVKTVHKQESVNTGTSSMTLHGTRLPVIEQIE